MKLKFKAANTRVLCNQVKKMCNDAKLNTAGCGEELRQCIKALPKVPFTGSSFESEFKNAISKTVCLTKY